MRFERFGLGLAKGLALTFRHLGRNVVTAQYPEKRLNPSRRIRGQQFVWNKQLCTGCSTCAKSCPHGIIHIETSRDGENRYAVNKFEIELGRCMFCGLCVEACPYEALYMGRSYEQSQYSRGLLLVDKDQLMLPNDSRSAYGHKEIEESLPEQTLLVYGQISRETAGKNAD